MNNSRAEQLIEALRKTGNRITPQRIEVCRALAGSREHPTALELYRQVNERIPTISQATVYNTLTVLRDLGEVVEVGLGQDRTHYEPDPTPHVNLICLRCDTIQDLAEPEAVALSRRLAGEHGMTLKAARLDIYGFCEKCSKQENENESG